MMRRCIAVGILLASIAVAGCDTDILGTRGSGDVTTEAREVSGFDEVVLLGSGDVFIEVAGSESLTIEAEDNIIPLLSTEVEDGRLELKATESISPTEPIRYTITAEVLDAVVITGSGRITATAVDTETFAPGISGSGNITAEGRCTSLASVISGSGNYDGSGLVCADGDVTVSGSGNAIVNVTGSLEATVTGSGNIQYIGDPSIDRTVTGSGTIEQR